MSNEIDSQETGLAILAKTPFRFADGQFWTSLNFDKPEDAVNLFKMRQTSDKTAKEVANTKLNVVHILRHWAEGESEVKGEIRRYIRTVFLTENGEIMSAGSIGIERDIETLFALGVVPPWNPPLEITTKIVTGTGNRDMLKLELNIKDVISRMQKVRKGRK